MSTGSAWYVGCSACDEPVGKPYWPNGCACSDEMNEWQARLLAVVNEAWDSMLSAPTEDET